MEVPADSVHARWRINSMWFDLMESEPRLLDLAMEACARHGVSMEDLKSPRRNQKYVRARAWFAWQARARTTKSYPQIGRFLGNRDHTTILNLVRKHQKLVEREPA